jgi:protein-disulfide isomerase
MRDASGRGMTWVAGVLFVALTACGGNDDEGSVARAASAEGTQGSVVDDEPLDLTGIVQDEGDPVHAPVVVIEFSDFGCVFCARFHSGSYAALRDEFVASGDVIWRYVPVTIGGFPNGDGAASTALCVADQTSFPGIRDRLYGAREVWLRQSAGEARQTFRGFAAEQAVDLSRWEACMDDPDTRRRLDTANRAAGAAGVGGTPSFLVQGFMVQGAPALENFQDALRQLVADVRAGIPTDEG